MATAETRSATGYGQPTPVELARAHQHSSTTLAAASGGGPQPLLDAKSLVADILLLKRVIDHPVEKSILVLPYVALVQEKLRWLRALVDGVPKNGDDRAGRPPLPSWQTPTSAIRVGDFFRGSRSPATLADCDVAVCTIEKANALVNAAIEDSTYHDIGALVLDELHMIADEGRGCLLELLATKLMSAGSSTQIIGMSATLPNPQLLARWLQAKFYIAKYRPIPVAEYLVYDNGIYPTTSAQDFFRTAEQLVVGDEAPTQRPPPSPGCTIAKSGHQDLHSPATNAVVALAVETAVAGHGAIVFCGSRASVQRMAVLISDALPTCHLPQEVVSRRRDLLASLQALPGGFEAQFAHTIARGVGFHHDGLTAEERQLVADAYDAGTIRIMVATCSLAAGINLPARRVILQGARMGRDLVGPAMLRQMRGRAGRKGKDEIGKTYLCCQKPDLEAVAELLEAEMPPVVSCFTPEKRGITRALLEVVIIRLASTTGLVDSYVSSSLLWHTMDHTAASVMVGASLAELMESGLIQRNHHEDGLEPTALGQAVVAGGLAPDDGIFVHSELKRALESFVLDWEMHVFYLFTPVQTAGLAEVSWPIFRNQMESLDESGIRAIRLIGVNPALVHRLVNSGAALKEETAEEVRQARIYRRAYSAFQLRDLCNEMPVHDVSVKYAVPRGQVQNLAQSCHGFAAGMITFCQRMGRGMNDPAKCRRHRAFECQRWSKPRRRRFPGMRPCTTGDFSGESSG